MNDRGRTLSANMKVPEGAPADVKQMIDSMQRGVQNFSAPLPDEPVGLGAKWEVRMVIEAGGLRLNQTATYTLKELSSDGYSADVSLKQSSGKQEMKLPNLPPGTTVEVQSMTGEGAGTLRAQLNHLVPTSKLELTSAMESIISSNGAQQPMKANYKVALDIHPK